jgi:hypothetical protein
MTARHLAPFTKDPRDWYGLASWKARRRHQLCEHALCAICEAKGLVTPATVADHHPPHKGDWNQFRLGPLRSLCRVCHESAHNRIRVVDIDEQGYPIDPDHPFNAAGKSAERGGLTPRR